MYTQEEIKAAGLDDFRVFLRQVWDHLGLPKPTPVQNDIARTLQVGPDRLIIEAFRGVGKTWITAAYVLWTLFLDPQKKVMVVSASQPLADNFAIFCKSLINDMPLLAHLRPRASQRTSNLAFDVGPATPDPSPSIKSAGITGQITGSRADVIVPDDIEVPKNSYTHVLRERLAELVKEFDAILKPGGKVRYLGTPQIEQSIYNRLDTRGYTTRIWPAEIPDNIDRYHGKLSPFIVKKIQKGVAPGTPVEPTRFSREELNSRLASYGRAGYALQFMLDTSPSDADRHPLRCSDFIVSDIDKDMAHVKLVWSSDRVSRLEDLQCGGLDGDCFHGPAFKSQEMASFSGTVAAVDPSAGGKDETAYAIVKYLHGMLYLVDVGGFKDGFSEMTLERLALRFARWGVNYVITEKNYGGGMFDSLLKPVLTKHKAGSIDDEYKGWSKGQKELRVCDTLEPILQTHRLVVHRRLLEEDLKVQAETPLHSFVFQMSRLTRDRGALAHDDRVEAVSMAVGYWTEKMARDRDLALGAHREQALEAELRKFHDQIFDPFGKKGRNHVSMWN